MTWVVRRGWKQAANLTTMMTDDKTETSKSYDTIEFFNTDDMMEMFDEAIAEGAGLMSRMLIPMDSPKQKELLASMTEHCESNGIEIPPGLHSRPEQRFAVIRNDRPKPKIVALTFGNIEDALAYMEHAPPEDIDIPKPLEVLDFRLRKRYSWDAEEILVNDGEF